MIRSDSRTRAASFGLMPMPTSPAYSAWRLSKVSWKRKPQPTGSCQFSAKRCSALAAAASQPLPPAITQRPLRGHQHGAQVAQRARRRPGQRRLARAATPGAAVGVRQHVLGQHQHHRPGAALQRGVKGTRHVLGQAVARRAPRPPTWPCPACPGRTSAGSRLPGRPRGRAARWPPGRRTGSSACESWNAVCSPMLALVAPGPRVTKQMPGRPLSLPCASAMKAAPPSCRQAMKRMRSRCSMKAVEHGQETFAGHAEGGVHALGDQGLDKHMSGQARIHDRSPLSACGPTVRRRGPGAFSLATFHRLVNYSHMPRMPTTPAEPRLRDADRSQQAILAAARDEFAEHGLGGARMDRIAERAALDKRLIYYYFENKDSLFLAVLEDTYLQHPRGREAAAPDRPAAGRGGAQADRVHLELLPRAPGVPDAAEQRQPAPRAPPRGLDAGARAEHAADRRRWARCSSAAARAGMFRGGIDPMQLYISIAGLSLLLPRQQPHAVGDLRPQPDERPRRAAKGCRTSAT